MGYFYPWHGIDLLIDTYYIVRQRFTDTACLLVGDGPVFSDIKKSILEKHIENDVLLMGAVPHEKTVEYISLFDIAIMPNSNAYGSPVKVLEYMASGRAIVASNIGQIKKLISHGETGLLCPPGDHSGMAAASGSGQEGHPATVRRLA